RRLEPTACETREPRCNVFGGPRGGDLFERKPCRGSQREQQTLDPALVVGQRLRAADGHLAALHHLHELARRTNVPPPAPAAIRVRAGAEAEARPALPVPDVV